MGSLVRWFRVLWVRWRRQELAVLGWMGVRRFLGGSLVWVRGWRMGLGCRVGSVGVGAGTGGVVVEADGGVFGDLERAGVHRGAVEALAALGVFEGTECGEGLFCPRGAVQRWVMAVWLVRILDDGAVPLGGSRFVDVDPQRWWAPYVERLAELGVTKGCRSEPLSFCPSGSVTRAQMASFLVRAFGLGPASSSGFVDVDAGSVHAGDIDALAASGSDFGMPAGAFQLLPVGVGD